MNQHFFARILQSFLLFVSITRCHMFFHKARIYTITEGKITLVSKKRKRKNYAKKIDKKYVLCLISTKAMIKLFE